MESFCTQRFWDCYWALPEEVRMAAQEAFSRWSKNPWHPSLSYKLVQPMKHVWSVRINRTVRALGKRDDGKML
jgi:hypothetical protein